MEKVDLRGKRVNTGYRARNWSFPVRKGLEPKVIEMAQIELVGLKTKGSVWGSEGSGDWWGKEKEVLSNAEVSTGATEENGET